MISPRTFDDALPQLREWRRDFHAHPELMFDVHRTAGLVETRLREMGVDEVVTGVGRTGLVGVIHGRSRESGRIIGLRADMDALPMQEVSEVPHASVVNGKMHACGHDGHTTMLLGAAQHLARHRDFDGTVVLIFQPAEESGLGGLRMVEDGLMKRFGIQSVFALHNSPGLPIGQFATCEGGVMGSADLFRIEIGGKGSHAAFPHQGTDPAMAISQIVQAFQTIVSRTVPASVAHVVSITQIHMGTSDNIIAESATISGTVRSLSREARKKGKARMAEICDGAATMTGTTIVLDYIDDVPVTFNDPAQTAVAIAAAERVVGAGSVDGKRAPSMGAEDFSFMLEARPGNFMWIGNGSSAALHNQAYDFDDAAIPYGCAYFVSLVQTAMPLRA